MAFIVGSLDISRHDLGAGFKVCYGSGNLKILSVYHNDPKVELITNFNRIYKFLHLPVCWTCDFETFSSHTFNA